MMWNGTWGTGPMGIGVVELGLLAFFGSLLLLGIILVVVWLARGRGNDGGGAAGPGATHHGQDPAMRIARERLARGEITKEEFDEIVACLSG